MTRSPRLSSRRQGAAGALFAAALAAASWAACQTPTSATVVVTTNVRCEIPTPSPTVSFVAASPDELVGAEDLGASATKECKGEGEIGQVVLLPAGEGDGALAFRVVMGVGRATDSCGKVTGEFADPWERCIVARRRLSFVEGEALEIAVPLLEDCLGVECSETATSFTTCVGQGECVAADLDPNDCIGTACGDDDLEPTASSATSAASVGSSSVSSGQGGEGGGVSSTGSSAGEGGAGGAGGAGGEGGQGGAGGCEPACDAGEACVDGTCEAIDCGNDAQDGDETDVDCGGSFCLPCDDGRTCDDPVSGAGEPESCESRLCRAVDGELRCAACGGDPECAPGTCSGGVCIAPGGGSLPLGATCMTDGECQSAQCAAEPPNPVGTCCNRACSGTCFACSAGFTGLADGLCSPTLGTVDAYECNPGSQPCSTGRCDGVGDCAWLAAGAECRGGVFCSGPTLQTNLCDADHECQMSSQVCEQGCVDDACQ